MSTPHDHVQHITEDVARLRVDLLRHLDAGATTTPRAWAEAVASLQELIDDLHWCRDAATRIARTGSPLGRLPWRVIEELSGVPDSTLAARLDAFTAPTAEDDQ